jgi:hypothetical protein
MDLHLMPWPWMVEYGLNGPCFGNPGSSSSPQTLPAEKNMGADIHHCRFSRQIPSAGMTRPCSPSSGMQPVVQARVTVGSQSM